MRTNQFLVLILVACATMGAAPQGTDNGVAQDLKAVIADVKAHPEHWTKHRVGLIERYKKIGHDVSIDTAGEFQTLLAGYSIFTAKIPANSKRKTITPEQQAKGFADFIKRNNYAEIPFTEEGWKAAQGDQTDNLRYRLFKGFQRKHKVIGMQADELMTKLAAPAWSNEFEISYPMGPETGLFSIDTMSLHFKVSSSTVVSFKYVQN